MWLVCLGFIFRASLSNMVERNVNDRLTVQSNQIFETIVKHSSQGGQHIKKSRDTKKRHPQRQYTGQLPKRPHRGHNTVNKISGKQRQHPREDTHIHSVEQVQPQGMKNRETTKYSKSY